MKSFRSPTIRRAHGIVRAFLAVTCMALLASWNFPVNVGASAGELDPAFGSGGKVTTDMGKDEGGNAIALQPDGKLIVAGWAQSKKKGGDYAVARYNRDGSLDSSFGVDGVTSYDFNRGSDYPRAVAIQSDGKIVVAGKAYKLGQYYDFALVRFNTDGSLDSSFGSGGQILLDFYGGEDVINGVAIQSDGKIIVAGQCGVNADQYDFALACFNPDGSADTSFGSQGRVNTDFLNSSDSAYAMAIQSDGRIVLAGDVSDNFGLARYNSDGSLDPTFGAGGKVDTDFYSGRDWANAVVIQPDGKILAAGVADFSDAIGIDYDFAFARYNADGSLDASFGTNGKASTDFFANGDYASGLVLQPDGRIIATGYAITSSNSDFALARYNSDGSLDTSFGLNGKANTDFGGTDWAFGAVLTPNGRVIAAGHSISASTGWDIAVACYKAFEVAPQITGAEVIGKKLYIYGKGFDFDADLLMNGDVQKKTSNDSTSPSTMLIAKKSGKKIERGETVILQVRNPDDQLSDKFIFTRPIQ